MVTTWLHSLVTFARVTLTRKEALTSSGRFAISVLA
jgi:hypothetical protein